MIIYLKIDHFLDFVSRPEFIQDVAYGNKISEQLNSTVMNKKPSEIYKMTMKSSYYQLTKAGWL